MPKKVNIIFEDNHLLIVEKPINMLAQGDKTGDLDLLSYLKQDLKIRYQKKGEAFLGLIHRLDRPVGGVMVFAKTSKAAGRLSEQLRNQEWDKYYLAVIKGQPPQKEGILRHYLKKDRQKNKVKAQKKPFPGGKEAILEYRFLAYQQNLSLLALRIITGRSHQIRVQWADNNTPLFGDQKYGSTVNKVGQQLALYSFALKIIHPVKKEPLIFFALPNLHQPWNLFDFAILSNYQQELTAKYSNQ